MTCENPCPSECRSVFDRVLVSYLIAGGTRVMWELLPEFTDPGPLSFQLQVGQSANPEADDWADVGLPVTDQYFAVDDEQRVWGKTQFTHYRVVLTTSRGTHYSDPTGGMGILSKREWLLARNIIHQRKIAYRVGTGACRGYLLKRRWTGVKCRVCLDLQTEESRNPFCPSCYGTGMECGYFYPQSCVWAQMSPKNYRTKLTEARGTTDDISVGCEMLMTDVLGEDDIWVNALTDDRWYVHEVQHTSEIRGVGITAQVRLALVPFSSPIYGIEIPQQLAELGH